jgi:hypothetical protein
MDHVPFVRGLIALVFVVVCVRLALSQTWPYMFIADTTATGDASAPAVTGDSSTDWAAALLPSLREVRGIAEPLSSPAPSVAEAASSDGSTADNTEASYASQVTPSASASATPKPHHHSDKSSGYNRTAAAVIWSLTAVAVLFALILCCWIPRKNVVYSVVPSELAYEAPEELDVL